MTRLRLTGFAATVFVLTASGAAQANPVFLRCEGSTLSRTLAFDETAGEVFEYGPNGLFNLCKVREASETVRCEIDAIEILVERRQWPDSPGVRFSISRETGRLSGNFYPELNGAICERIADPRPPARF